MTEIVWEFRVAPEKVPEFEQHYGPNGTWPQLFRRSPQYVGTLLLRDPEVTGRYLTVDCWNDVFAFDKFQAKYSEEYKEIDVQMEHLTLSERKIGVFETV